MIPLTIPDLGEGIDKVQVIAWHAQEGGRVTLDDDIVELVTDKAVFNIPAPANGILRKIEVPAGQEVSIGTVLGFIE